MEENVEAGILFNLNYNQVCHPFCEQDEIYENAPSHSIGAYSHLPFSCFLGFSGHKKISSVRLATPFKDLS